MVAGSMKIVFVGQPGFFGRAEALASALSQRDHSVTVLGHPAHTPRGRQHIQGVRLARLWKGWFSLIQLLPSQPDAIHITGRAWALRLIFLRWLLPETILIWTLETLPTQWAPWQITIMQRAQAAADSVTATSRAVQWKLLAEIGVRALYIPEGFSPEYTSLPSIHRWKLWRGRYGVTSAASREELTWVAEAWRASGTRKKLVAVNDVPPALQTFLKRKYPFLMFRSGGSRVRQALLAGAHVIVTASAQDDSSLLLLSMWSGRPIISVTHPLPEELYGTTAEFVREGDTESLARLLASLSGRRYLEKVTTAQKRALRFFRWERIFMEYLPLYAQLRAIVPLDSASPVTFPKPAVQ